MLCLRTINSLILCTSNADAYSILVAGLVAQGKLSVEFTIHLMGGTEMAVILAYTPTLSLSQSLFLSTARMLTANSYFQTDADLTQTSATLDTASKAILWSAIVWDSLGSIIHNLCCFRVQYAYLARFFFSVASKKQPSATETQKRGKYTAFPFLSPFFFSLYHSFPPPINLKNKNT